MTKDRIKTATYWATTILGPSSFVIGGVLGLRLSDDVIGGATHLGYPVYFVIILSIWKILGAVAITAPGLPRVKEWAYAGFFFDLTAAAISHAAVGDAASDIVAPLVFLALLIASWTLRPQTRRLATAPSDALVRNVAISDGEPSIAFAPLGVRVPRGARSGSLA